MNVLNKNNTIVNIIIVTFFYFALACASEYIFEPQHTFFTIRLAPGLGLIAALLYGVPALCGVFLGEFLYYFFLHNTETSIPIAINLAANAVIFVFIGSRLIQWNIKLPNKLEKEPDCIKFLLLGGFVASIIPSLLSVYWISFIEPVSRQSFFLLSTYWWFGQVLGILIISPIALCFMLRSTPVWRSRIPLVPILMTVLLVTSSIIYTYVTIAEKEKLKSLLEQKSLSLSSSIKLEMSNYEESLYSVKSLIEYTPDIEPTDFEAFSKKIKARQLSIPAISYQKLVKDDERQEYENRMREIYSNKFQITERDASGNFIRAAERDTYTPITMRSYYNKNSRIMGFDTSTSVHSELARQKSKETNKVAITHAFKLDSSKEYNKSIILYLPLIREGLFSGYVSLSVYVDKAIQAALKNISIEGFYLNIWDGDFYENKIIYYNKEFDLEGKSNISNRDKIDFVSHEWSYELTPELSYLFDIIRSQMLAIFFCIILTSITSIRLLAFTGKKYELSLRAYESEENNRLLLDSTAEAIYGLDLNGNGTFCNAACLKLLGYESEDDLLGKNMHDLIHHSHINGTPYLVEDCPISKSFLKNEKYHVTSEVLFKKDGCSFPVEYWSYPINREGETVGSVVTFMDISDRIQAKEQLSYQASHDALTGLVNRIEFERRIERLLSKIKKEDGLHALCFMDIDQFKIVNDTCGHAAGDEMLNQLGSVLNSVVRQRDTLARLGGDEFGVLMENCSLNDASRLASSLLTSIQDYEFSWEGRTFKVSISIGLVAITNMTNNLNQLLKDADAACYMAKEKGRNRIHIFHEEDTEIAERHGEMQWVTRLNKALEQDMFCLYAQAIVPLENPTETHYELLIRMVDKDMTLIPPGVFLPAAERYNLITKIDSWVISHAFKLLLEHPIFLRQINFVSINLSGPSLADPDFIDFVFKKIVETKMPPEKICFEITETAAISNLHMASLFISLMKELGCRFALDDFGSGLSSFGYLKNLPVDFLKIDGMFVKDIVENKIDHAMVKSINEIGHVMGMKTIAEFVENDVIRGMLKEIGVNYVQGFGVGKPQPFDELLRRSNNVIEIRNSTGDDYG
jgi:diguanylate cyclase (GGDEF)-like protein/PAS domain S-box-containing protein